MFRGNIFSRSQTEIKLYFKQWKIDVESKGYLDPEFYADARKIVLEEGANNEDDEEDKNPEEHLRGQAESLVPEIVVFREEPQVEEGPISNPLEI